MYWSGASALYQQVRGVRGAMILMYHSVPSPDLEDQVDPRNAIPKQLFEKQIRFLARHRHVISIDQLVAQIDAGETSDPGTVVITFDDGYRDNLSVPAPILARYNLPATLFLATGYVDREEPQWIDELYTAFRHRTKHQLRGSEGDAPLDLDSPASTTSAYRSVSLQLLSASHEARRKLLDRIEDELRPSKKAGGLTLSWRDAAELAERFPHVTIGVHTREHLDLTDCAKQTVDDEIGFCSADVKRHLGLDARHFSYPYGRSNDSVRAAVESHGFGSAVATEPPELVDSNSDSLALPRFEVTRDMTLFRLGTSGAHPAASRAFFGRAY